MADELASLIHDDHEQIYEAIGAMLTWPCDVDELRHRLEKVFIAHVHAHRAVMDDLVQGRPRSPSLASLAEALYYEHGCEALMLARFAVLQPKTEKWNLQLLTFRSNAIRHLTHEHETREPMYRELPLGLRESLAAKYHAARFLASDPPAPVA